MNSKDVILSDISKSQKDKYPYSSFLRGLRVDTVIETKGRWWLPGVGVGARKLFNGYRVSFYKTKMAIEIMIAQHCECLILLSCILKMARMPNFIYKNFNRIRKLKKSFKLPHSHTHIQECCIS